MLVDLTQQVYNLIEREIKLTGFWESPSAKKRLRAELQNSILVQERYSNLPKVRENRKQIISRLMEIAEKKNDVILFAG